MYHDLSVIYISSIYHPSTCDLSIICLFPTYHPSIHHLSPVSNTPGLILTPLTPVQHQRVYPAFPLCLHITSFSDDVKFDSVSPGCLFIHLQHTLTVLSGRWTFWTFRIPDIPRDTFLHHLTPFLLLFVVLRMEPRGTPALFIFLVFIQELAISGWTWMWDPTAQPPSAGTTGLWPVLANTVLLGVPSFFMFVCKDSHVEPKSPITSWRPALFRGGYCMVA